MRIGKRTILIHIEVQYISVLETDTMVLKQR